MTRLLQFAEDAGRDARLTARLLSRRPAFAWAAVATLALGIGAPTTVFSVVDAVLLRPLPFADPGRIIRLRMQSTGPSGTVSFDAVPAEMALRWNDESQTLASLALFDETALTLETADGPYRLSGISATPNLFTLLGVASALGRPFDRHDPDAREVVLSHDLWMQHFSGRPDVIGSLARFDGVPYRVIGVMPAGFGFPTRDATFWIPQHIDRAGTRGMLLPAVARLRPGVAEHAAVDEGQRYLEASGDERVRQTLGAQTLQDQLVGTGRGDLWMMMAAVTLVTLIAAVNVALLLLTRGAAREREFAVRLAIGAGRERLVRQVVVESLVLAVAGGAAGILVGALALPAFVASAPSSLPRVGDARLDGGVILFSLLVTLLATFVFGPLSAGQALSFDPVQWITHDRPSAGKVDGRSSRRRLNALAVVELAVTMVLLASAGALLRSFVAAVTVPQGFDASGALALQVNLPQARYPTADSRTAMHARLLETVRALPGVSVAGLTTSMPNRQATGRFAYDANGIDVSADPRSLPISDVRMVTPGFLEAAGLPLLTGRTFSAADTAGADPVIVISQHMARLRFPDGQAVGRMLYSETGNRRVIGVVGDVRSASGGDADASAAYLPLAQSRDVLDWVATVTIVVRATPSARLQSAVRAAILSVDPLMPPFNVRLLRDEVASLVAGPRFAVTALALFGVVALVMAFIGVYSVMAYAATQRMREIGIRIAVGATNSRVLASMLREGMAVVGGGLTVGLLLTGWAARVMSHSVFALPPVDPASLGGVAAILVSAGLAAVYLPARRATRVSVLAALRDE
jgi:putative ABC transport system permease protein